MQTYLGDGRLPIDNNDAEQLMKQIALGRKNRIFIRSVAAGERAADFLTLVSSAVRNDLDVWPISKTCSTNYWPARPTTNRCVPTSGAKRIPTSSANTEPKSGAIGADRKQRRRVNRRQGSR